MRKRVKQSSGNSQSLLILLVIMVVASLVVDLLYLNVLYDIQRQDGLGGELAEYQLPPDYYLSCEQKCYYNAWLSGNDNSQQVVNDFNDCMLSCCYMDCNDRLSSDEQRRRGCIEDCYSEWGPNIYNYDGFGW